MGCIQSAGAVDATAPCRPLLSRSKALGTFSALDTYRNGRLSRTDALEALRRLGVHKSEAQLQQLLAEVPQDREVELAQFISLAMSIGHYATLVPEEGATRRRLMFARRDECLSLPDRVLLNMTPAGGPVAVLRDNMGRTFKEVKSRNELSFFKAVVRAGPGGEAPDGMLDYLAQAQMIPHCELSRARPLGAEEARRMSRDRPNGSYFLETDDSSGRECLVFESLVSGMAQPAMCDIKLGQLFGGSCEGMCTR